MVSLLESSPVDKERSVPVRDMFAPASFETTFTYGSGSLDIPERERLLLEDVLAQNRVRFELRALLYDAGKTLYSSDTHTESPVMLGKTNEGIVGTGSAQAIADELHEAHIVRESQRAQFPKVVSEVTLYVAAPVYLGEATAQEVADKLEAKSLKGIMRHTHEMSQRAAGLFENPYIPKAKSVK